MELMDLLWAYIVVFVMAAIPFFEAFGVIALGMLAGLPEIPVIIISLLGNIATVLLLILFINKIKEWRRRKKGEAADKEPTKRAMRAKNLWNKYGLPGLSLIGPLFVGSHLTAFMCLSLGGTKKKTTIWMLTSIILWGLIFALLTHAGIDFLNYENQNFFKDIISKN
ncbi:small multi-drug export protein [Bacillus weihaiensis]|nr:small multi-drug export protein [Bacillus weihaiensis]